MTRTNITETSMERLQSPKKLFLCLNIMFFVLLSSHMISLTNKNTELPRAKINFLRHSYIVLLFVVNTHKISLTNVNTVLL